MMKYAHAFIIVIPTVSDQKGALEKNHEIYKVCPDQRNKLRKMNDKTTLLLLNHINSEKRDSLNGHSPYEVSRLLLDNRLHKALGLAEIPADEVIDTSINKIIITIQAQASFIA